MSTSTCPARLSPDLSSSPPLSATDTVVDLGGINHQEDLLPTLTSGGSSPELPPLSSLPNLTGSPYSPAARHPGTDSTYYTASWGSPYEIPAPTASAVSVSNRRGRSVTASSDIEEDSPNPRFGLAHLLPSRLPVSAEYTITPTRPSTPLLGSPPASPTRRSYFQNPARSIRQLLSPSKTLDPPKASTLSSSGSNWALRVGGNWWNQEGLDEQGPEVELQVSSTNRNAIGLERNIEPFQLDGIADTAARTDRLREKGHKSRDSNLTLTQEDFWPTFGPEDTTPKMFTSRYADVEAPASESQKQTPKSPSALPPVSLVLEHPSPLHPSQRTVSTTGVHGSRSKKRVMYKGKSCWISIPQEPQRGAEGNPPIPLSAAEVVAKHELFEKVGYDTRGFDHWHDSDPLLPPQPAQNRAIFPDPADELAARKTRKFVVSVPDRLAWKAYEDHLREEKLRALGVSLGGEPDTAPMSRQSSNQYPNSLPFSPPVPTSSAGSQRQAHQNHLFQTGFVPGSSNHTSTRSIASPLPSLSNPRGHRHRQSMFSSPTLAQQGVISPVLSSWSPQLFINQHGIDAHSPFAQYQGGQQFPFGQRDELRDSMQQQQQHQQVQANNQHRQQLMQQHTVAAQPASMLAEVPEVESEMESLSQPRQATRETRLEIVNPKPSHRHNISVKLERDIQNSDYHLEDSINRQLDEDEEIEEYRDRKSFNLSQGAPRDVHAQHTILSVPEATNSTRRSEPTVHVSNPWANDPTFQSRDSSLPKQIPLSAHSSKSSVSGLNVAAKEFNPIANPSATFNPGIFSSSSFSFQPAKAKPFIPNRNFVLGKESQSSNDSTRDTIRGLSASAPAFSPQASASFSPGASALTSMASCFSPNAPAFSPTSFGTLAGVSNVNAEFSFVPSASVFKPTAPVFRPSLPNTGDEAGFITTGQVERKKIFKTIDIQDIGLQTRRSKAVPIIPPSAQAMRLEVEEDEDGRITQGDLRQKRARRASLDADQVPQFALPDGATQRQQTLKDEHLQLGASTDVKQHVKITTSSAPDAEPALNFDDGIKPMKHSERFSPVLVGHNSGSESKPGARSVSTLSNREAEAEDRPGNLVRGSQADASLFVASSAHPAAATPVQLKPASGIPSDLESSRLASHLNTAETKTDTELASPAVSRSLSNVSKTVLEDSSDRIQEDPPSGMTSPQNDKDRLSSSVRYFENLDQPSFQEIDAVMRHFDDEGSEAGIEKDVEQSWPNSMPAEGKALHLTSRNEPEFTAELRSDAPSPSPRRSLWSQALYVPEADSTSLTQDPFSDGRAAPSHDSPIRNLNETGDVPISEWDDAVSSAQDEAFRERSGFFDVRISSLIQGALENRLDPMEKRLQHVIQEELARITATNSSRRHRSRATVDSDADDEDDVETDAHSRGMSPKRDRRMEKFKIVLQEALAASNQHVESPSPLAETGLSDVQQALEEIKLSISQAVTTISPPSQLEEIIETVVSRQNQALVSDRVQAIVANDHDRFSEFIEKFKDDTIRVAEQTEARKDAERRELDSQRLLRLTEEELELVKIASQDAHARLKALENAPPRATDDENNSLAKVSKDLSAVKAENEALKETLEEYRISSNKWRHNIEQSTAEKERIHASFAGLKVQAEEAFRIRETMRSRIESLHSNASTLASQVATERASWARTDSEHRTRYEVLSARIEAEGRTRVNLEKEIERLGAQEQEAMRLRVVLEQTEKENARVERARETLEMKLMDFGTLKFELVQAQKDNSRLEGLVDNLKSEIREHQDVANNSAPESVQVQKLDVEASDTVGIAGTDLEREIARVVAELEGVKTDAANARAKHEFELEQEAERRNDMVRDLIEAKNVGLQEQRQAFEERLEELRKLHDRDVDHITGKRDDSEAFLKETHTQRLQEMQLKHERAAEQAIQDKCHFESQLQGLLSLADSKVDHLQDKVLHLEEKLKIAKSAAHAAASAAQSARSLPVLLESSSPSAVTRLPEKISPQALRESIVVLQEQLQERESRIENLELKLSEVDTDAPAKIKARDTEIGWLRELLGVRVDDLGELISALSASNYNREAVRSAAIRIRASLQMEQQEKERQLGSAQIHPTFASISNFASPKAAQFAAVIGTWRKAGSSVVSSGLAQSVSSFAGNDASSGAQTPSKAPAVNAPNFLSGLMTPPASSVRRTPESRSPPTARPPFSSRSQEKRPIEEGSDRPVTPPLMRRGNYDQDAEDAEDYSTSGFYDDEGSTVEGTPRGSHQRLQSLNAEVKST